MKTGNAVKRSLIRSLYFIAILPLILLLTRVNFAQESWGNALFRTQQHDFGRVALGADAEFSFEITNAYASDVRLVNVRSSCSCASAKFSTSLLKPGETGVVIARLNTTGQHLREKSAVLTVQLETVIGNSRRVDTVQLFVSGYIRPDVLLTPGSVEFGAVSEGTPAERVVLLEYTGRANWALTKVERSQPYIYAKAEEIKREQGNVSYRISTTLREDAPPGYIQDVLRFTTNELQSGRAEPVVIMLPVRGAVMAPIRPQPSPMLMGILIPGENVAKNIVVRGEAPFRITEVSASDDRFRFAFSDQTSDVQLISVAFSAKQIPSELPVDVSDVIRISTNDSRQNVLAVTVFVRVVDQR